jgi:chromosomal replication initiation ATPase DnaA
MTITGLTTTPGLPAEAHIAAILQAYTVKRGDLLGPSKAQNHCRPRRELFARLICEPLKFVNGEPRYRSLPQAGKIVGRRDHSTVFYGLRKWSAEHLGTHPKAKVAQIRAAYIANQPQEIAA